MNKATRIILAAVLERLREKSTWTGLSVAVAVLIGRQITPEYADALATVGTFVASIVLIMVREDHSADGDHA